MITMYLLQASVLLLFGFTIVVLFFTFNYNTIVLDFCAPVLFTNWLQR